MSSSSKRVYLSSRMLVFSNKTAATRKIASILYCCVLTGIVNYLQHGDSIQTVLLVNLFGCTSKDNLLREIVWL